MTFLHWPVALRPTDSGGVEKLGQLGGMNIKTSTLHNLCKHMYFGTLSDGTSNAVLAKSSVSLFLGLFNFGTISFTPTKSALSSSGLHPARLTISRSSLMVKLTCSGPRRPTM